jgi:recombinational DNA repair ATPase RecF
MHISEIRIRHFRNFCAARFSFQKGVNTLIGENGSGKTNALYAIRLLDKSLSRNATRLHETAYEESSKLLYVVASRAKKRLHLIAEAGRFTTCRKEYQPCKVLRAVTFDYDE